MELLERSNSIGRILLAHPFDQSLPQIKIITNKDWPSYLILRLIKPDDSLPVNLNYNRKPLALPSLTRHYSPVASLNFHRFRDLFILKSKYGIHEESNSSEI